MSYNSYKKDYYNARHLSILRESPEDMFLNGERSEDIYVNFDDTAFKSVQNQSSFAKSLPAVRPNKPPPPLPDQPSQQHTHIQHPPVPPARTMVAASTQTNQQANQNAAISNNPMNYGLDKNVPDILAFTRDCHSQLPPPPPPPLPPVSTAQVPEVTPRVLWDDNDDFESYVIKYIELMHDDISWSIVSPIKNDPGTIVTPQNDYCRFELRRNAEKEFYAMLNKFIEPNVHEHYIRIFEYTQQIRSYCETFRVIAQFHSLAELNNYLDYDPLEAACNVMKMSFNEFHRRIICNLGGLEALAQLIVMNNSVLGDTTTDYHHTVRKYTCMALTNLTYGIGPNKAFLSSNKYIMNTLIQFLSSSCEDVKQVAASVVRNLSWKADEHIQNQLRDAKIARILTSEAMKCSKESCLKALLSALWNISSHSVDNKIDICNVPGGIAFLVDVIGYKTIPLVENAGGILRNISIVIANNVTYRNILREQGAYHTLLHHLKSPSLTVVGNSCGTLSQLVSTAPNPTECHEDLRLLWQLNSVTMLRNLVQSRHRTISIGAALTLKCLLSARAQLNITDAILHAALISSTTSSNSSSSSSGAEENVTPFIGRKLAALQADIDQILASVSTNGSSEANSTRSNDLPLPPPPLPVATLQQQQPTTSTHMNISGYSTDTSIGHHSDLTHDKAPNMFTSNQATQSLSLSGYDSRSPYESSIPISHCLRIPEPVMMMTQQQQQQQQSSSEQSSSRNGNNMSTGYNTTISVNAPLHVLNPLYDYDSDSSEKPRDYSIQFCDDNTEDLPPTIMTIHPPDHPPLHPTNTNHHTHHSSSPSSCTASDSSPSSSASSSPDHHHHHHHHHHHGGIVSTAAPLLNTVTSSSTSSSSSRLLMMMEQPKIYATEGTPAERGSPSIQIDDDDDVDDDDDAVSGSRLIQNHPVQAAVSQSLNNTAVTSKKTVSFPQQPATRIIQDTTPLMFSRNSSVGSLDSFEVHSIHSSIPSEYSNSRRTSEMVSPTELPESPGDDVPNITVPDSFPSPPPETISVNNKQQQLIQECIETGMNTALGTVGTRDASNSNIHGATNNYYDQEDPDPEIVLYADEGTPFNYSTKASSLSELSISEDQKQQPTVSSTNQKKGHSSSSSDSEEQSELLSEIIQAAMPKEDQELINQGINTSTFTRTRSRQTQSIQHHQQQPQQSQQPPVNIHKMPQFYYCDMLDSPRQYGVEGTPNSASQRDSLCSDNIVQVATDIYPTTTTAATIQQTTRPPKPPKRTTSTLSSSSSSQHNTTTTTTTTNTTPSSNNNDMIVYMTENTPADYSRASPAISHSCLLEEIEPDLNTTESARIKEPSEIKVSTDNDNDDDDDEVNKDNGQKGIEQTGDTADSSPRSLDLNSSHQVESRSGTSSHDDKSSLSSLSIESAGLERTLLQQCISSAMPAPKLRAPISYSAAGIPTPSTNISKRNTQFQPKNSITSLQSSTSSSGASTQNKPKSLGLLPKPSQHATTTTTHTTTSQIPSSSITKPSALSPPLTKKSSKIAKPPSTSNTKLPAPPISYSARASVTHSNASSRAASEKSAPTISTTNTKKSNNEENETASTTKCSFLLNGSGQLPRNPGVTSGIEKRSAINKPGLTKINNIKTTHKSGLMSPNTRLSPSNSSGLISPSNSCSGLTSPSNRISPSNSSNLIETKSKIGGISYKKSGLVAPTTTRAGSVPNSRPNSAQKNKIINEQNNTQRRGSAPNNNGLNAAKNGKQIVMANNSIQKSNSNSISNDNNNKTNNKKLTRRSGVFDETADFLISSSDEENGDNTDAEVNDIDDGEENQNLISHGVETILASLELLDNEQVEKKPVVNVYDDSELMDNDDDDGGDDDGDDECISNVSSVNKEISISSPSGIRRPIGGPKIIKPTLNNNGPNSNNSGTTITVRGAKKSLTGRKAGTGTSVTASKSLVKSPPTIIPNYGVKTRRTPVTKTITKTKEKEPIEKSRDSSLSSIGSSASKLKPTTNIPNNNSTNRIQYRNPSTTANQNGRNKIQKSQQPIKLEENNNNGNNNLSNDNSDMDGGVWLIRNELCPDTVCN